MIRANQLYLEGTWWVICTIWAGEPRWLCDRSKTDDFWTPDFEKARVFYERYRVENIDAKLIYQPTQILNREQCIQRWPLFFGLCPHCRKHIGHER